ncbi:MAG: oxidoreductase, partial [Deltaproteobacteria bacterium]|nr:oxidoreductase [Deltaproteobacteria bacterium]
AKSGHLFIDFGNDEYTRGRPHPMIDPEVRDQALAEGLKDPEVGIILVDLVLGYGAHSDPAGHLVTSLPNARANSPLVVASVVGTDEDIQNRDSQVRSLEKAGILVAPSNADAAAFALAWVQTRGE